MVIAKRRGRPAKVKLETEVGNDAIMNSLAVAGMLGCGERAVLKLMKAGEIRSKQIGCSWLTTRKAVMEYLEAK